MNEGWKCPECGVIWAPWVGECSDCNHKKRPAYEPEYCKCIYPAGVTTSGDCTECGKPIKAADGTKAIMG